MKTARKLFKLALPGWFMHWWLPSRYGIRINNISDSKFVRLVAALSPYAVSAILQQRVPTDVRVAKYFLPYGMMRKHMLLVYGKQVGTPELDGKGLIGRIRSLAPYGLVLWWDGEEKRIAAEIAARAASRQAKNTPATTNRQQEQYQKLLNTINNLQLRTEVLSMRILAGGKSPSASVVLTGAPDAKDLEATIDRLCASSLGEIEIITAIPGAANAADQLEPVRGGVKIVPLETSGKTLREARNMALAVATGDYVSFLEVGDYYATDDMLEWLVLAAKTENAEICGGKKTINWKNACDGISAKVFDRQWLLGTALRFINDSSENDNIFLACARCLTGREKTTSRPTVNHVPVSGDNALTATETKDDILNALLLASKTASIDAHKSSVRKALMRIVEQNIPVLRDLTWCKGRVSQAKADKIKALAKTLSAPELADDLLQPLVSVVVPAYNSEKYLAKCLDSLLAQTLESIEIICVDDGSTDSTGAIADRYAAKHPRIKALHRQNGGLSAARNTGMAAAKGKYIGFVDSDDYVEDDMFSDLSSALEMHPECELAKCAVAAEYTYEVSEAEKINIGKYFTMPQTGALPLTPALAYVIDACAWDKLYRHEFLEKYSLRFPEGCKNEDEAFFFFCAGLAKQIYCINKKHYHYLRNQDGIMAVQQSRARKNAEPPDAITRIFPLVFRFLDKFDRLDLMGVAIRHLCGAILNVRNSPAGKEVMALASKILHDYNAPLFADLMLGESRAWFIRFVGEIYNINSEDVVLPPTDETMLPVRPSDDQWPPAKAEEPFITFIVPVFNVDRYLTRCIESLRRQTRRDIEIICVDDGSCDRSGEILDNYASRDPRIVVIHQVNQGVSAARNKALSVAKGKYIQFVDGDDYLEARFADEVGRRAESSQLDACLFDFACFDYNTLAPIDHYWTLRNHIHEYPGKAVFAPEELSDFPISGGAYLFLWRRTTIENARIRFTKLKLGEDLLFVLRLLPHLKRMDVFNKVFYHYRRGNPTSAVSRLNAGVANSRIDLLSELSAYAEELRHTIPVALERTIIKRMLSDALFYPEKSQKCLAWMQQEGFERFAFDRFGAELYGENQWQRYLNLKSAPTVSDGNLNLTPLVNRLSCGRRKLLEDISGKRKSSVHDMYIVMGQLNSTENEPIDSWTFFRWLQDHGVPSRYVMWKKHKWLAKIKREDMLKDVILLSGDGVADLEFAEKCADALIRAKAVVQENGAVNNALAQWMRAEPGMWLVYLQHGVSYHSTPEVVRWMLHHFSCLNTCSKREEDFFRSHFDEEHSCAFVSGGLPRWDLLKDESQGEKEKLLFVMPTWRKSFNGGLEVLKRSAWYQSYSKFLSPENVAKLKALGLRVVFAPHHHLANHIKNLGDAFDPSLEIADTASISYWIRHASMCITDFSSVAFDFLFLDKPVVYWFPDRDDMLLNPADGEDGGKVANAWMHYKEMFNVTDTMHGAMEMIKKYAANGFRLEKEKRDIASTFFYRKTGICKSVYEGIEKLGEHNESWAPAIESKTPIK